MFFPYDRLVAGDDGHCLINFCISSKKFSIPPLIPVTPPKTLGGTILREIYSDTTQGDIVFMFDGLVEPPSTGNELSILPESDYVQAKEGPIEVCVKDQGVADPSSAKSSGQAESSGHVKVLKAHKLILQRWPYFKRMFESGFAEGGSGEKQMRIKDTKIKTFKLLLRFMSTCRLAPSLVPKIKYTDELGGQG